MDLMHKLNNHALENWADEILDILPVRYSMPGWAYSPYDGVCQALAHFHLKEIGVQLDDNCAAWLMLTHRFQEQGSRVYVPTRELVEDLNRTSVHGVCLKDVPWACEGFEVVLPKECVSLGEDGYLAAMFIARIPDIEGKEPGSMFRLSGSEVGDNPRILIGAACTSGAAYSVTRHINEFNYDEVTSADVTIPSTENTYDKVDVNSARDVIVDLALKLISYMSAVPDDLEVGGLKAKAKTKRKVNAGVPKKPDWWRPWILGSERTEQRRLTAGSTGGTKMSHWRAGHWRRQPHGPIDPETNTQATRIIWIQATQTHKDV